MCSITYQKKKDDECVVLVEEEDGMFKMEE